MSTPLPVNEKKERFGFGGNSSNDNNADIESAAQPIVEEDMFIEEKDLKSVSSFFRSSSLVLTVDLGEDSSSAIFK